MTSEMPLESFINALPLTDCGPITQTSCQYPELDLSTPIHEDNKPTKFSLRNSVARSYIYANVQRVVCFFFWYHNNSQIFNF